jgi:hypothetical protein
MIISVEICFVKTSEGLFKMLQTGRRALRSIGVPLNKG